jgi:hypothetical protein
MPMSAKELEEVLELHAEIVRLRGLLDNGCRDMEQAANRLTGALDNHEWKPSRSHIESDRNLFKATASALRAAAQ